MTRLEEIRERAEWQRRARELDSQADLDRLWLLERVDEMEQALRIQFGHAPGKKKPKGSCMGCDALDALHAKETPRG